MAKNTSRKQSTGELQNASLEALAQEFKEQIGAENSHRIDALQEKAKEWRQDRRNIKKTRSIK